MGPASHARGYRLDLHALDICSLLYPYFPPDRDGGLLYTCSTNRVMRDSPPYIYLRMKG
jgi:hypothetical protein